MRKIPKEELLDKLLLNTFPEPNTGCWLWGGIALEIRRLYPSLNQFELADKFSITQSNVSAILRNKTWKHLI